MKALPLTVIGGYLGAGKTTLINRLLQAQHGQRLMVLVNDFGAINIDAKLLVAAERDKIELSNGCVCCTMGADLFHAVGDVLNQRSRPDHLLVEASGIADPARIARLALAEPELRYAGIVTVVDGPALPGLLADPKISAQITGQITAADMLAIAKGSLNPNVPVPDVPMIAASDVHAVMAMMTEPMPDFMSGKPIPADTPTHPTYIHRVHTDPGAMTEDEIRAILARRPASILRVKGLIPAPQGGGWEVHSVGQTNQIRPLQTLAQSGLVAIALADDATREGINQWWQLWESPIW